MNEDIIRHQRKPKRNGYRHRRNPSIRTLMKSKRFESAAPKHEQMERIIFDVQQHDLGSTMTPKPQRLESVINRLRIENSHVLSKADTLQSKNNLLQKTIQHSKQQYAVLEAENKKLKNHNKYLQQRLKELQHKHKDNDDDIMSIVSLKTQVQNLEDIQRKGTSKNKKIKHSLEEVINDPGLPVYLRSKLWKILPEFYISHHASPSLLSAQMKLEYIESDHEESPELQPIPMAKPVLSASDSVDKKGKLMDYKKRKVSHNRNLSESISIRGYTPIIKKLGTSQHQRSLSSISNTSLGGNIDSVLSKTRNISLLDEDLYLFDETESDNGYDEEEKIETPLQKKVPTPRRRSIRPKPPPPPPRSAHDVKCQSDGLTQIIGKEMKIKKNYLNLSRIHEDVRARSHSENISPSSSRSIDHKVSISPPKLISIPLETPQALTDDDDDVNHRTNLNNIQKRGRSRIKAKYRGKAHTEWNPHIRSKSHQPRGTNDTSSPDSDSFSVDTDNLLHLTAHKSKSKFFHIDLGWASKKKKKKKESINISKKEDNKLNTRRSILRLNNKKKLSFTKKDDDEGDTVGLTLSKTALTDHDTLSDETIMNVNPLSPMSSSIDRRLPSTFKEYKNNALLLSSPESNVSPFEHHRVSALAIPPAIKMSVSTPNSPMKTPLKPNIIQSKVKSIDDLKRRKASHEVFNDRDDSPSPQPHALSVINKSVPKGMTRMDQIRMERLQQKERAKKPKSKSNARQKRFYSATPTVSVPIKKPKLSQAKSETPTVDSPIPGSHLNGTRRRSLSMKRKKKRDGTFNMPKKVENIKKERGRRTHTQHTRSMSLRDVFSFSLSPRSKQSPSERERKRKKSNFSFKRRGSDDSWSGDSFDDKNKVWTLKDLIREMVSTQYDEEMNRMRNALILCYSTFTTSVALFEELRRFFRMSLTVMTSTILYFEDDNDDKYISNDDRRWKMRQKITESIIYWIKEFWIQDFAQNGSLQKEIELFKSDIRTCITGINRSQPLIEGLMQTLTYINNKYGGINPKNLNLSLPTKNELIEEICDDYKEESSSETQQYETSVVIHDDITDDDDDDATFSIIKSDEEKKEELEEIIARIRSVSVRFPDLIKLDVVVPHNFNIMELDPEDVAIQLTLLDSFVFMKINGRECIEQNWKKVDKAQKAPNILKMIAQFNNVSKWVQITILKGSTPRLRKRYIKKMISMATHFMQNANLSSLCAFYNALTSTNISQLHSTWKLLSKSKRKELSEIKALFGWKMNKFKEMQQEIEPPCIPHIGIILQILFQIDEGKHNKNPINGSVNYIKMMMLHEQIYNMQILQSMHYRDEPNFAIQKLLIREFQLQSNTDDNALYKMAKKIANSEK